MSAHSQAVSTSSSSLPASLPSLLTQLVASPIAAPLTTGGLAVADTGATDHMLPDRSCFISYKSVVSLLVRMGNNSFVPVLGRGSANFALNGKCILVRNMLHVPGLAVPLYSLRTHVTQRGCGFFGTQDSGFLVYFPSFVLSVDTAVDCHLSFTPLGTSAPLHTLDYVQPWCAPSTYLVTPVRVVSNATPSQFLPALIESDDNDDNVLPVDAPSPPSRSPVDLSDISWQLHHLTNVVDNFTSASPSLVDPPVPTPSPSVDVSPTSPVVDDESPSRLLSTMSPTEIANLLHRMGSSFPSVRPCDTANGSDTKTHWSSEELHRIMGCRKFQNYKHIIQVSRDVEWADGGKFPLSFGSYATIPKSQRRGPLDKTWYKYLDAVHMDITFGDCISIRGLLLCPHSC